MAIKVHTQKVDIKDLRTEHEPFVRFSGAGCGLPGCNCSPKYFMSISNGKDILSAELSMEQFSMMVDSSKSFPMEFK
jgi:hypothetical protein